MERERERPLSVDARGNILATTRTTYNIGLDPQAVCEEDRAKLPQLARLIGKSLVLVEPFKR